METLDQVGRGLRRKHRHWIKQETPTINIWANELWPFLKQKWEVRDVQEKKGLREGARHVERLQRWRHEERILHQLTQVLNLQIIRAVGTDSIRVKAIGVLVDFTKGLIYRLDSSSITRRVCKETTEDCTHPSKDRYMMMMMYRKETMLPICWAPEQMAVWVLTRPTQTNSRRYMSIRALLMPGWMSENSTKTKYSSQVTFCQQCR